MFEDSLRNVAFVIVRFSNYASGALLFGLAAIALLVLRPSLSRNLQGGGDAARYRVAHRLGSLVMASIVVSAAATLLGLLLQSLLIADIRGGQVALDDLWSVLDNSFGFWYALRLPFLLALAVLLGGRVRGRVLSGAGDEKPVPPRVWWGAWMLLSLIILLTNPLSGHAAVSSPAALAVVNDLVHLVAGAIWFSGVVVLAAVLPDGARGLEPGDRLKLLAPTVVGFSRVALISIAVVGTAGTVNSFFNVERLADLFDSGYGRALSVKLVLFAFVLLLGGINHLYVRKRLQAALQEDRPDNATSIFRRTIAAELAFGIAILGVTAILAGSARTRQFSSLGEPAPQHESAGEAGQGGY